MKKLLLFISSHKITYVFSVLSFFALAIFISYNQSDERIKYEALLKNHEYSKHQGLSPDDLKAIPKQDRPDLAWEQNFLMTLDPALGYPPVERLLPVYKKVQEYKKMKAGIPGDGINNSWVERGPNNVAGRVRALMFDPNDATSKKVWAGSVSGGLWYNNDITDPNSSWHSVDDFWSNLAISCIAYDPNNTQIFYIGTGEGWGNSDRVKGDGIWRTDDGGTTWTQLTIPADYIQKITITSTGRIIAATNNGLMVSDGGTWLTKLSGFITDIEIDNNGTLYAGVKNNSTAPVFKSTNSGDNWIAVSGLPANQSRIEIAIAPSDNNVIYAIASDGSNISWFKKTKNGGTNWSDVVIPKYMTQSCTISTTDDFTRGQAWYDLILAVHPTSPDTVFVGGIDVNRSTDGGQTWKTITYWTGSCAPYSHADNHALEFRPGHEDELITGSDGGVSYSPDAGSVSSPSFTVMNKGFNITQFYAGAMHPDALKHYFLAGAQDNGTHQFDTAGINTTREVTGGDGAFCFIDQTNPDVQITSYVYNNYYLSKDGGVSFSYLQEDNTGSFINPAGYDNNLHILYSALDDQSINRIKNLDTNPEISSVTVNLGSTASHIKVSPYTTGNSILFVGTEAGRVFKITNADGNSPIAYEITGTSFPIGNVSCIEVGANENELLVTFSNYGVSSLWYTNNGGNTWTEKEGNLPDMPVRWALFNPNNRNEVLLATEVGVWASTNFGDSSPNWTSSVSGLANVRTDMLLLRESDNEVLAITHGRGLFTSDAFSAIDKNTLQAFFSVDGATNVFPGTNVQFQDLSTENPTSWTWEFEGGTPATSTDQNPLITYNDPGLFQVKLTVSNGTTTDDSIRIGYIKVSENGGWSIQASAFNTASRGIDYISVVDKDIVWAKAFDGSNTDNKIKEFTKTINGGSTWTPGTIDITGDIYPAMIHAYNADTAWVPMYPNIAGAGGGIYFTGDGGTTWTKQTTASFTGDAAFANVVYFWDKDQGFCMGDPNGGYFEIYTTTDGGTTWTRTPQANIPNPLGTDEYGTVGQFCIGEDGTAFFNTTKGRIFISEDKGANWSVINTPINDRIRIAFSDKNNGFVIKAGDASQAYYTNDGGANWTKANSNHLFSSFIQYVKGTNGRMYISSSANTSIKAGASYSIDGGKTWKLFDELENQQCLAIGFADMTTGWIGQFNANETQGGILKYNGPSTIPDFIISDSPVLESSVTFTDNTLTIADTSVYEWDFGENASPATADTKGPHDITYSVKGVKTISLTVNGQTSTKEFAIYPTSIEEHKANYELLIYPNPNNGMFTLRANTEKAGELYVQIYNMNGQVVYMNRFTKNSGLSEFSIQLTDIKTGVYIMKVMNGQNFDIQRLIIK
jgi:PKD repeat protein